MQKAEVEIHCNVGSGEKAKPEGEKDVDKEYFAFDKVQALLSDMTTQGIRPNTVTNNTLIDAYGKA
ncbi:pentatricopeptide repeat-containing protein [Quercus suber]|uniref:Pentatricopeptide repeat-containing protein n=1 Tax=Quercus suber TaxID=58331 RepID=A0AAW0JFM6_QUESU